MKRPNDRLHPSARLRSLNETEPGSANPSATDNFYETQDARHSDLSQDPKPNIDIHFHRVLTARSLGRWSRYLGGLCGDNVLAIGAIARAL